MLPANGASKATATATDSSDTKYVRVFFTSFENVLDSSVYGVDGRIKLREFTQSLWSFDGIFIDFRVKSYSASGNLYLGAVLRRAVLFYVEERAL